MERVATRILPLVLIAALGHPVAAQQTYGGPERLSPVSVTAISKRIQDLEYHFSMREDGSWTAPNRGHDLRSVVHAEGLEVVSRTAGADGFRIGLRLIGQGREGALEPALPVQPQAWQERVELSRPGLTEWFVNRVDGLEHGFTVQWPPEGDAAGPFIIEMALDTTLAPRLTDQGRSVEFAKDGGLAVLRYADLVVSDATGAELPARMRLAPGSLRFVIEDSGAVYPVTIDPLMNSPAWTFESNQVGATIHGVNGAGDVNGDGFDDVIVGAEYFDNGETDEGKVFVFHGSAAGLGDEPDWSAEGNQVGAYMGWSVAGAGDINGDGYDDVVIGAVGWDNVETDEGAIWVYLGSSVGLLQQPHLFMEGHERGTGDVLSVPSNDLFYGEFGFQVRTAGDVNGDGYDDIIVGHLGLDHPEVDEGAAYVFLGSPTGLAGEPDWVYEIDQTNAIVAGLGTAGDVNGDGYDDIVVGSPWYDNGQENEGRIFVFHGSPTGLPPEPDVTFELDVVGARLGGQSAYTAGDVNADGYDDIIAGALLYTNGEAQEGGAFVWHGSPSGLQDPPDWHFESNQVGAYAGDGASTAGDVNGDGYSDVIVGAWRHDGLFVDEGRAWVFHGGPSGLHTSPDWTASGLQAEAYFGRRVASAGDVNGDGYGDVIVSARAFDNGETDEGRAYVYHGFCDGNDLDGDLRCDGALDCDDSNSSIWATPGEVVGVAFTGQTMLTWVEPTEPGATSVLYDTLRSTDASDFSAATCIETNGADTAAVDSDALAEGSVFFYLVRAENDCPQGHGSLGETSDEVERTGSDCLEL